MARKRRELNADDVLAIARTIPPDTARKMREHLEARSDEQLKLQGKRASR